MLVYVSAHQMRRPEQTVRSGGPVGGPTEKLMLPARNVRVRQFRRRHRHRDTGEGGGRAGGLEISREILSVFPLVLNIPKRLHACMYLGDCMHACTAKVREVRAILVKLLQHACSRVHN